MPLCSIITAAGSPDVGLALECWESIAAQENLGRWELEWCVQEDGAAPVLGECMPEDPRVRYDAAGMHRGIATTRNFALTRARGEIIRVLDQDDVLLPLALSHQLSAFEEHPEAAWVAARAADWGLDESLRLVEVDLPAGVVPPGALIRSWRATGQIPIHCAGLGLRTPVARAFGGWAALPRSEDFSLLAAVSTIFAGVFLPSVDFYYRQWPGQTTRSRFYADAQESAWQSVQQRVDAIAALSFTADSSWAVHEGIG